MLRLGMLVEIISSGFRGVITAMRIGSYATNGFDCEHDRPETPLLDYVEIDGEVQVHPSRVREVNE